MSDPISEAENQMLEKAMIILGEHFENVQIFVSRKEDASRDQSTSFSARGVGNYFVRYGQVKRWLLMSEEIDRQMARDEQS